MNVNKIIATELATYENAPGYNPPPTLMKYRKVEYTPVGMYVPRRLLNQRKAAVRALQEAGLYPAYNAYDGDYNGHGLSVIPRADTGQNEAYARQCGWVRTIATNPKQYPLISRLLKRTMFANGLGSPLNHIDIFQLARVRPSPGGLEKLLGKVIRRADAILRPYGIRVSWRGLVDALTASRERRVGKVAFRAARMTAYHLLTSKGAGMNDDPLLMLRGWAELVRANDPKMTTFIFQHREAKYGKDVRTLMQEYREYEHHHADGVHMVLSGPVVYDRHGITVQEGHYWVANDDGRGLWYYGFLVRSGERSYHRAALQYIGDPSNAAGVAKEALAAWQAAKKILKGQAPVDTNTYSVLVSRSDSYEAGNCRPGTEAFLREKGWAGKKLIPARMLIGLGERAENACQVAAKKVRAML